MNKFKLLAPVLSILFMGLCLFKFVQYQSFKFGCIGYNFEDQHKLYCKKAAKAFVMFKQDFKWHGHTASFDSDLERYVWDFEKIDKSNYHSK